MADQPETAPSSPQSPEAASPAPSKNGNGEKKAGRGKIILIIAILIVAATGAGIYFFLHRNEIKTDDAQMDATVNTIAPKISGYIVSLPINNNQNVKAGDLLLQIDPTDYKIKLARAEANLQAAQAKLAASGKNLETTKVSAPSNVDSATADVAQAQAQWEDAHKNRTRVQSLSREARSQQQLDSAIAQEKAAKAVLDSAKAKLRDAQTAPQAIAAAQANADELMAEVRQAESDVAQAQSDLDHTKIVAPIAGHVTNKNIEQGDYVQPGQQLFSLVGNDIYVVANFKETQLKAMKIGDKADIDIDAFPDLHLEGKIDSFQYGTGSRFSAFPAENATGNFVKIVQRVPVKIILTNGPKAPLPIGPGMSVTPTVYTK